MSYELHSGYSICYRTLTTHTLIASNKRKAMNMSAGLLQTTPVTIEVTHIGEDYGKVEVTYPDATNEEYEVAKGLAYALSLAFHSSKG